MSFSRKDLNTLAYLQRNGTKFSKGFDFGGIVCNVMYNILLVFELRCESYYLFSVKSYQKSPCTLLLVSSVRITNLAINLYYNEI